MRLCLQNLTLVKVYNETEILDPLGVMLKTAASPI